MPHQSMRQRMADLDRRLLSAERFTSARLEVKTHTGELLYAVGGCFDRIAKRYVDRPCTARVVVLKEDQEAIGRAIALYLQQRRDDDDARKALLMAIGERGGGKTFIGSLLIVTIALALIGSLSMAVSIFSAQNAEIRTGIAKICDPSWHEFVKDPSAPATTFINGSQCRWFTSRNPKMLRQAQIDWELVVINEGQDQPEDIFTNGVFAVRNKGGLTFVATNPPTEDDGDWVAIVQQGLEVDSSDGEAHIVRAGKNDSINQASRTKAGRLVGMVDRNKADADFLGLIKLSGTVGYPGFTRTTRVVDDSGAWVSGHICERGHDWVDVTQQITAQHFGSKIGFDVIAGCDFQTEPGSCAAIGKLYQQAGGAGPLLLYVVEFVGTTGTESDLTLALASRGYFPGPVDYEGRPARSCLLVGDATGARQNAEHRKRDPYSFTRLRADGWSVMPPAFYGPKRTPWNPLIPDSRKQMKSVFSTGVVAFSPECAEPQEGFPSLLDSFQRAKVNAAGKFDKKKHYTHGPDGVRYMAWRFLPRGQAPPTKTVTPVNTNTLELLRKIRLGGG